jgi:ABC-2 type transport system permease protein
MMRALFYKEIKEHVLSRKGLWIYFALSILLSALAFSFVTFKELSLLAQVEVNITFLKILLGVGILVSLIIGSTMISNEKEQGTLESLLLTPLSNFKIIFVKAATICVFWFGVLIISLPYFYALTYGTQLLPTVFMLVFIIGTFLVLGFSLLSLAFSAWFSSTKNATLFSIVVFLITVLPMFLSTKMKRSGFAYVIDRSSPISSTLLAAKDLLINKFGMSTIFLDVLPVFIFFIVAIFVLLLASRNIKLLGGE